MYKPKYFTLKELCYSRRAEETNTDNFPSWEVVEHLRELAEKILDPLREAWGDAVNATSGFRCILLNKLVGGADTSAHPLGYAADLYPANGAFDAFVAFAVNWIQRNNVKFDQLIIESDGNRRWLHVGLYNRKGQQRRQILNIKK